MLKRPATALTLSKDEVTELINQLQEQALEERLKARIPKNANGANDEAPLPTNIQENQKGVPVGLWKNSPLKPSLHHTHSLTQLNTSDLEGRSEIQRGGNTGQDHEDNPFYQPELN
ncbi:anaphase-promoting complex subunit Cdc26p [Monosporozyma unispora]|nr:hypothetical protein C6P44_002039 [Kazachstania unispora]